MVDRVLPLPEASPSERGATLVIAKLDRLARNVAFIANLMESSEDFVAVDMPEANRLTLHMLAAVAEHEREAISTRTKDALATAKARGTRLDNPRPLEALQLANAAKNYQKPAPEVQRLMGQFQAQGKGLREIARELNRFLGIKQITSLTLPIERKWQKAETSAMPDTKPELPPEPDQNKQIALALLRPMLFQPKEDAFSGLKVQTAYAMASDEALVGGDFWDTFAYDHGHVALVIGDVMGHGLDSAVFTTELKHTMRAYIREHEKPARILYQINQFLYQSNRLFREGINTEGSDAPVCITLAVIERGTGAGTLAIAGIEPPILVRANGDTEQMAVVGMPLGVEANEEYLQVAFQLEAGDTLILFTDGITEARHGSEFLEVEGLIRLAVAGNNGTLKQMADTILDGARDFAGGTLRDDASLVLVRRTEDTPNIEPKHSKP